MHGRNEKGQFEEGHQISAKKRKTKSTVKDMLNKLLKVEHEQDMTKLEAVCQELIDKAICGNLRAIQILFDYSDGKPQQRIEVYDEREKDVIELI